MRRWNGWGDQALTYPLPPSALCFLEEVLGSGAPPQDAKLAQMLHAVPRSRLPVHPLVTPDVEVRLRHACGQSLPDWVAFPSSEEEVAQLITFAVRGGAHLIPYGGGTSVVGHVNPSPGDAPVLTVDMSRINRLLALDEMSRLATFGAGVAGPRLETNLRARGYTLGHFPQSFEFSTLGGWIATRSSGQQSLYYGRIEELFAAGRLLSPAGRLDMPPFPASAAGPDLRQLVLGSEGRLGIVTQAALRVSPLPEREDFHAIFFPDWGQGVAAVRAMAQARLPLSILRLSDAVETATTLALAGQERLVNLLEQLLRLRGLGPDKCMLLMGITGRDQAVKVARKRTVELARAYGGVHVGRKMGEEWRKSRFRTPYLRNTLWERGYAVDTLETATRWSDVAYTAGAIRRALRDGLKEVGERVHGFSHLSHIYPDGASIYVTYLFRLPQADSSQPGIDPDETLRRWRLLKAAASDVIVAAGGTISHQHGVGVDHLSYLPAEKGRLGMAALRSLCRTFDPEGVMNPGKLVFP
jgi:alkyldihydroxyacetonephosphate synthase